VFVSNLLHGSSLALLEDEQKFKLGGCVGAHKNVNFIHQHIEYLYKITKLMPYLLT
jgi:hypothetical protein